MLIVISLIVEFLLYNKAGWSKRKWIAPLALILLFNDVVLFVSGTFLNVEGHGYDRIFFINIVSITLLLLRGLNLVSALKISVKLKQYRSRSIVLIISLVFSLLITYLII